MQSETEQSYSKRSVRGDIYKIAWYVGNTIPDSYTKYRFITGINFRIAVSVRDSKRHTIVSNGTEIQADADNVVMPK